MDHQQIMGIYTRVERITEEMLEAARREDWDRVTDLEMVCSEEISVLQHSDTPRRLTLAERQEKARVIRSILNNDRHIRDLASPWMAKLSAMMQSASAERKLSQAYGR